MPPMYPRMFYLLRRGCPVSFDSTCRRAAYCLPLTHKLALYSPPLAEDVSSCFFLRKILGGF